MDLISADLFKIQSFTLHLHIFLSSILVHIQYFTGLLPTNDIMYHWWQLGEIFFQKVGVRLRWAWGWFLGRYSTLSPTYMYCTCMDLGPVLRETKTKQKQNKVKTAKLATILFVCLFVCFSTRNLSNRSCKHCVFQWKAIISVISSWS